MRFLKKRFWRKGSGEVFGFLCVSPIMVALTVMLVGVVELSCFKEKLEYTAYVACRAAAVSETKAEALEAAKKAAEEDLRSYDMDYDGDVAVTLRFTGGGREWKKGNYITCTVRASARPISPFINAGTVKSSLTMAIEKPET